MEARNLFLAGELRARRFWLAVGWALVLLVVYLSLTAAPIDLDIEQGDKFSHAFAYLVLMSWFANLYETWVQRIRFAVGFVILGIVLEFIQGWTGYRSLEVADMAAGTVGVSLGWILAPPRIPSYLAIAEALLRDHS